MIIGLYFAADSMAIFIQILNFSGILRKTFCKSDVSGIQGHRRSLTLVPIESSYATSY